MSVARVDLAVTVFKDRIFAVGGRNLLTMESLDSKSGQWLAETSMTGVRCNGSVARTRGYIVLAMFVHVDCPF